ncbi:MAG: hypothetical protein DDT33_01707 [Firmicutes bacterium]|nr:hypothetical protein [Bacillota bacterium]
MRISGRLSYNYCDGSLNKESDPEHFKDDEIRNQEVSYGIEFTGWAEWLGMEIDQDSFSKYSESGIIGHCLWEMTFYGFTQDDIKKAIDRINKSAEEAKTNPSSCRRLLKNEDGDEFFWGDKDGNRVPFLESNVTTQLVVDSHRVHRETGSG